LSGCGRTASPGHRCAGVRVRQEGARLEQRQEGVRLEGVRLEGVGQEGVGQEGVGMVQAVRRRKIALR
jgi:hypothetical protein